jgi:diguanylate cyclase (GGDEF)-like protein
MAIVASKSIRWLISFACFSVVSGAGFFWQYQSQMLTTNEQQFLLSEITNSEAITIERRLSRSLSATNILSIEIKQNSGNFTDFDTYAQAVIDSMGGISNLQLAPNGIISQIYPLVGNEKAIGHNILRDDSRRNEAMLAIAQRQLTLVGPFKLVQGGRAIIGRNPVFINVDGKETFWGFTSALIYFDKLLAVTKLKELESKGYQYTLSRIHPDTGKKEVFARSKDRLDEVFQSAKIALPNTTWTLTMSRAMPNSYDNLLAYSVSLLLGLFAAWFITYLQRQPELLQQVVKQKTAELERLAFNDYLTGLANRRYLNRHLQQFLFEQKRYNRTAALFYLDLDDFKRVNDSMGHDYGDQLLIQIADRLSKSVRVGDVVSRLGGDEFAVLLLNTDSVNSISKVAEKLIEEIKQPVIFGDRSFVISASIGITLIPKDGNNSLDLLRNADMAMYSAKHAGKNSYSFFDQKLQQQAIEKHRIETELATAVQNNELVLHYQPLVELKSNKVVSLEALVRWQHPEEGLIYPDHFISIAEDSGQIVEIGYWVIKEVCELISRRENEAVDQQSIAINLSPKQFKDPNLLENIRSIVNEANIDPHLLEIEITESSLMTNIAEATYVIEQLRAIGIKIAIDDFGTGYSSLAQLKHFPVNKLKIDRSFIATIESDRSDHKIVRAIIAMAHTLQITVVAEGIENKHQLSLLKHSKCDIGQGYLFSRPVKIEQLKELSCNWSEL